MKIIRVEEGEAIIVPVLGGVVLKDAPENGIHISDTNTTFFVTDAQLLELGYVRKQTNGTPTAP